MSAVAGEDARLLVSGRVRFTARAAWFDAERRLDDITWHNCFRFLGISEPGLPGAPHRSGQQSIDAPKLFSFGEQHRTG